MAHPHDPRDALLAAAEDLLVASPDGEISTRAVCDAVGVTQPVLYRLFGDKQGLLDALAEVGLNRYAQRKAELEISSDPVADLRAGWVDHMAFATEHSALYRLMFSPRPGVDHRSRDGLLLLVEAALRRCAAAGAVRMDIPTAARMILSANVGLALNRMSQPDVYGAPELSITTRETLFAAILVETPEHIDNAADPVVASARQLAGAIAMAEPDELVPEERDLLLVWLDRLGA
jgi:AcrR family transcriptional regulator